MKLLLVEDDPADARFLRACLSRGQGTAPDLVHETCLQDALATLATADFDVVLLDLNLPDAGGESSVHAIKQVCPTTPIVVLSGEDNEEYAISILQEGVQDYLVKWDGEGKIILRAIRYAIERKRAEIRLNYLATYDALTGIPNRSYFMQYLEKAVSRARRLGNMLGLVFLDLDRFKGVNDALGHHFGDKLLIAASQRIEKTVRSGDVVARMGGDEFAVLLENVADLGAARRVAHKLTEALSKTYLLDGHRVNATVSIGVTIFPNDRGDPETLIKNADIAMYQAKNAGRNGYKFFTESMHRDIVQQHQMAQDMQRALRAGEFFLLYQPQFRLEDGVLSGAEALIRWRQTDGAVVAPGEFIGIAEEYGQIVPIGHWVAAAAFRQSMDWSRNGAGPAQIGINVSPRQILHASFCDTLETLITELAIDPATIELELTESCLVHDVRAAQNALACLKDLGFTLAIDDFGTGHSM
jgi:diguanylate cyclase (GGDEF)-like protein